MSYQDAHNLLCRPETQWSDGLSFADELRVCHLAGDTGVIVTDYPRECKPFYMRANSGGKTVACFDLLWPRVGELVGGSLREHRHEILRR